MELGDQLPLIIANATFRLDGGFVTPEAQQRFETAVATLGGLIGAEVTIDYNVAGSQAPTDAPERLGVTNENAAVETGEPTELSAEELRGRYLGMSLEAVLSGFPDIDEKHRRTATRYLAKYDIETVRDALITGRHNFVATSYIRVSVRDAMERFITDRLPGTEWHDCPIAISNVNMPFIASVAQDLRDIPAVALAGFRWLNRRPFGERLTMQDLFGMSVDDLTACFTNQSQYWNQVQGANTDEEREAGARAIARVAAQADAAELQSRIHAFAIDFLHARQQLTSEHPDASLTQPGTDSSL